MAIFIPSAADLVAALAQLDTAGAQALRNASGVPYTTIWAIKTGHTPNPRLDTVRRLWAQLDPPEQGWQPASSAQMRRKKKR